MESNIDTPQVEKSKSGKKKWSKWQDNRDKKRQKQSKKHEVWATTQASDGQFQQSKNKNGEGEYQTFDYAIGSSKFDEYYQKQFPDMSAEEFKDFTKIL